MKKSIQEFLKGLATFILLAALVVGAYRVSQKDIVSTARDKSEDIKAAYEKYGVLELIDCIITGNNCKKRIPNNTTPVDNNNTTNTNINEKDSENAPETPGVNTKINEENPDQTSGGNPVDPKDNSDTTTSGRRLDEVNKKIYDTAKAKLETIKISEPEKVSYDRAEWKHWESFGSSCWNVREEALYRQAEKGTIKLLDKNKNITKDKNQACYVASGKWVDPYSNEVFTQPAELDLDHIIPLSFAAQHGGQTWSPEIKKQFANDIEENLLIVSARENRSKSDKGPSKYMPVNDDYHCQYAIKWINISNKYKLSITENDYNKLSETLSRKCVVIK